MDISKAQKERSRWKRDILYFLDHHPEQEYSLTDIYNHFKDFDKSEGTLRSYLVDMHREGLITKNNSGSMSWFSSNKDVVEPTQKMPSTDWTPLIASIVALKESIDKLVDRLEPKS